jgi:hypothetical protein
MMGGGWYWNFCVLHVVNFYVGSLSKPVGSEDELHVIVGQLERLVTSLRRYVGYGDMLEYPKSSIEPWRYSTPEFRVPGANMLDNLMRPYFGNFPEGPHTCKTKTFS